MWPTCRDYFCHVQLSGYMLRDCAYFYLQHAIKRFTDRQSSRSKLLNRIYNTQRNAIRRRLSNVVVNSSLRISVLVYYYWVSLVLFAYNCFSSELNNENNDVVDTLIHDSNIIHTSNNHVNIHNANTDENTVEHTVGYYNI
ncbi:hypothetical protein BDC45DRAFT_533792 [Circinella umbellata]|nr:hypothetical protein BDC45DRAFT_533792 [Circinella umbellata]